MQDQAFNLYTHRSRVTDGVDMGVIGTVPLKKRQHSRQSMYVEVSQSSA